MAAVHLGLLGIDLPFGVIHRVTLLKLFSSLGLKETLCAEFGLGSVKMV